MRNGRATTRTRKTPTRCRGEKPDAARCAARLTSPARCWSSSPPTWPGTAGRLCRRTETCPFLDKTALRPLPVLPLNRLRSNLLIAIVSLFVLTGYGLEVFGECCSHREGQGQAEHHEKAPGQGDDCQCLCHQIISPIATEPLAVAVAVFTLGNLVAHADEFPPDAVPLGIEHPPQIT